jgi:DNA-binding PadR family transcriptional regulator
LRRGPSSRIFRAGAYHVPLGASHIESQPWNGGAIVAKCTICSYLDVYFNKYHNVVVIMLGEFEYLLLTAAARLGDDAYGAAIRQKIEGATKRRCSIGALYTTLDRLETKGLLKTWMGDATPQRGGRAKRMVRVTAKGIQAATAFYNAVTRVSRGVSWEAHRIEVRP